MPGLIPCQQITISPKTGLQTKIKINLLSQPVCIKAHEIQSSAKINTMHTKTELHTCQKSNTRKVNKAKVKAKYAPKTKLRQDDLTGDTLSESTTITSSSYSQNTSNCTTSSSLDHFGENEGSSDLSLVTEYDSPNRKENRNQSKPMLRIVQEMSKQRVVVSTIQVNRQKVRQWQQQDTKVMPSVAKKTPNSKGQKSRKTNLKQCRVIHDNFRNELLDQHREEEDEEQCGTCECNANNNMSVEANSNESTSEVTTSDDVFEEETEGDEDVTMPIADVDCIATGKLESNSAKKSNRMGGKLMAKRLLRQSTDGRFQSDPIKPMAPAKPPRTFGSPVFAQEAVESFPKSRQQNMRSLNFAIDANKRHLEETNKKTNSKIGWVVQKDDETLQNNNYIQGLGWKNTTENHPQVPNSYQDLIKAEFLRRKFLPVGEFEPESKPAQRSISTQAPQPSCPPLDEISPQITPKKLGWVDRDHQPPQIVPQHIVNMLYLDKRQEAAMMTSSQLKAQPQCASPPKPPPKETIDDVDGAPQSSRQMDKFCSETVFSTPFKGTQKQTGTPAMPIFESVPHSLDASSEVDNNSDMCMNCHCPKSRSSNPPQTKPTFSQKAIRRTKTLFVAGKNILNRSSTSNKNLNETLRDTGNEGIPFSDSDEHDLNTTPSKVDTTECLNKIHPSHGKPTLKQLDLAPANTAVTAEVTVESPKRMYEMFLASVKRTPQKSDAITSKSQQNDFDFWRTVRSPPASKRSSNRNDGNAGKPSAFLLSPRRLFGKNSARRHSLNAVPSSGTYKSYMDQEDDGFAIFIAEYLRKMYMQIESDRPIDAPSQPATTAKIRRSSSSKDIVDGNMFQSLNIVDCHPPSEPFYQEISTKRRLSKSSSAVYAVVNKKGAKPPIATNNSISELLSSKSYDSLNMLNNTNDMNLVSSIENLLEQHFLELQPKVTNEFKSMEDLIGVPEPVEPQNIQPIVANIMVEENSRKCDESRQTLVNPGTNADAVDTKSMSIEQLESEATIYMDTTEKPIITSAVIDVHHTASAFEDPIMDNLSATTSTCSSIVLTDSLCDEVIRGQNISDDIFNTMHRLETVLNFTEGASYAHAYPESDGLEDAEAEIGRRPAKFQRQLSLGSKPSLQTEPKIHKRLAYTLRNSFQRGSRIFGMSSIDRKTEEAESRTEEVVEVKMTGTYMQLLRSQINHQLQLRPQLQRAIEVCRKVSGFEFSTELVEAERLLLLSLAKETAARCEMSRINFDDRLPIPESQCSTPRDYLKYSGTAMLEIRRLEVSLRPTDIFDMYHKFFYVCVCSYRNQVQATYAQEASEEEEDAFYADAECSAGDRVRKIVFDRLGMKFTGLHPNFQVKIDVLMLRLPQWFGGVAAAGSVDKLKFRTSMLSNAPPSTESSLPASRFRSQDSAFVTPTNLWPINAESNHSRRYEFPQCTTVSSSSCIFCSSSQQRLIPFVSSEPHSTSRPTRTTNGQPLRMDFYAEIQLDVADTKGFLNVRRSSSVGGELEDWSRQWCWIRGCKLYMSAAVKASDQAQCFDQPTPPSLQTIDLTNCTNGPRLALVQDQYLIIQTSNPSSAILEYHFASDSESQLRFWLRGINHILQFIYDWRI